MSSYVTMENQLGQKFLNQLNELNNLCYVSIALDNVARPYWQISGQKWNKIRYLKIVDKTGARYKQKEYLKYFTRCPTLEVLVHEFIGNVVETYYRDVNREVQHKTTTTKYRLRGEKFAGVALDWLWY